MAIVTPNATSMSACSLPSWFLLKLARPKRQRSAPDVLRRVPTNQDAYDRWRQLWAELAADPDIDSKQFADRHGISLRQVQWIRSVGATGLLNSPIPPAVLLAQQLARANGHLPPTGRAS